MFQLRNLFACQITSSSNLLYMTTNRVETSHKRPPKMSSRGVAYGSWGIAQGQLCMQRKLINAKTFRPIGDTLYFYNAKTLS